MKGVNAVVRQAFSDAIKSAFPVADHAPIIASSKFGDYQCNSALPLYKVHGKALGISSPKDAADSIKRFLSPQIFSKAETSPQGFVTVQLSPEWIKAQFLELLETKSITIADRPKLRVLVDFSSPNVAKAMHVGHLRSTIIGESISRIMEFAGYDVLRINHVGDWGTQFGMLTEYMRETYPESVKDVPEIADLESFYRAAKGLFDSDENFKQRSRQAVVALQGGDADSLRIWRSICEVSRREFEKVYRRLGVTLEEVGESFYNDRLLGIVEELDQKNLLTNASGTMCLFTTIDDVPLMVRKGDGGYGYDSTDLAAIKYRMIELERDWIIYVTDMGQESHFLKIFEAATKAGWNDGSKRCQHVGFGVVQGEDGKKFKTRSGEVVKLVSLLDESRDRALAELKKRHAEGSEEEATQMVESMHMDSAQAIGYGAVKYFDLKQNRTTDYKFSFDRMLDPKGNTAVYMMYAYARICAIFRKVGINASDIPSEDFVVSEELERKLALLLLQFPDIVEGILVDLSIHRLADFMYRVSTSFSEFYQGCKVIGVPEQNSRLLLCESTRKVLQKSFDLLGITPLERI